MRPTADRPREACGVVGVAAPVPAAMAVLAGLESLQHRGDDSAGIAVAGSAGTALVTGAGAVRVALPAPLVQGLRGDVAVGHVRYATAGTASMRNAQPVEQQVGGVWFALAHNGNLVGCHELAEAAGVAHHDEESDTHLVSRLLAGSVAAGTPFERALLDLLPRLRGGFSFVAADGHRLYGVRDPKGLRPLFLGRLAGGWVLASETPALAAMGATTVREVEPGEVVVGEDGGLRTHRPFPPEDVEPRLCLFELVYFARADGQLNGGLVHMARHRAGAALADHAPLPVDEVHPPRPAVVVPVPDSASAAAEGFAARSGLPFGHGVLRNRDVGRSFLAPVQDRRERRVRDKLVVVPDLVRGRRVVLVDDSLVRGTTARVVVDLLRDAGAAEVHLRIASPPWRWPCYFGIAVVDAEELAAGTSSLSQIREQLGCDSLAYLPLEALLSAVDEERRGLCTGCLTGRYPVRVPRAADRPETEVLVPLPLPRPWPDRDALPRGA